MDLKSKIIFFLIITVTAVSLTSCKKSKNDVIPDVYIDFYLNLSDPEFFTLTAGMNSMIITSSTNNWGSRSAGYDNNGIIVYRSPLDEFYAYDRTCPHDFAVNGLSIKVNIDGLNAICPQCSTTYALYGMGTPTSGPGRYPLKNYKTGFDGQTVHVWHY
jgi:nitrite reductase/ring-hydroxylating ferredoxin subunit